jgi:PKD repeat protein
MRGLFLILLLFVFTGILWAKPVTVTVTGFVFDENTGLPANGQLITLKARSNNPPFVYFQKLLTDNYGYFSQTIEMPYSKGIIDVSTIDCNGQFITHSLAFGINLTNLTTSFVICYNPQLTYCRSDFLYLNDPKRAGNVIFKETSIGDIQNWYWDFGDGNFSDKPNPVHQYYEDGNYTICLTVSGSNGNCSDVFCENISVKSDALCSAMFTWLEHFGAPNTVQFWDLSQGDISDWQWDFGDGTGSTNQNPIHSFPDEGVYEVCLTVIDFSGTCSDVFCTEVTTGLNNECQAMFFSLNDSTNPFTRQFIDVSTGGPTSWQWSFGDSTYSDEQNPVHVFAQDGVYHVCLAIYSETTGCSDTYCQSVMISQQMPCSAYFNHVEISAQPYTYQFVDLSVGNVENRLWDFGDGKSTNLPNPVHSYYQNGEFEVCLTVTNEDGSCYDEFCKIIYVGTTPDCTAEFVYLQSPDDPFKYSFSDISMGDANTWYWDFGDGNSSSDQNPEHTFTEEGFYLVCLSISDSSGSCEDRTCYGVMVTGEFPCQADFDYTIAPEDPLSVQFTDASSGTVGFRLWDFGDGNLAMEQNPLHTYTTGGIYNVCLHVLDFNFNYTDEICKTVGVNYDPDCEAGFTFLPSANDPFSFQFTDQSTGNLVGWFWDFGDGNTSTLQNPAHTFGSEGSYSVCLTVTNFWGNCEDVFCSDIVIAIPELCQADFAFNTFANLPLTVQFTDLSSGIMTEWFWNFGDGNTSTIQNPVHVFADTGIYQVSLSIQNTDSLIYCSHSITKQVEVYVSAPECHANFVALPDSGVNKPNLFHFYDQSTGEPDSWLWDFGDGNTSTEQNPQHQFDDFGDYQVNLTITTLNPWGDDCTDTKILQFSSPEYFHFGGMVYAGDYPINNPAHNGDTAQVFVYRHHNNIIQSIDTSLFTNLGYYYFLNVLPGDYVIKVKLTPGSANVSGFFPAYFGNNLTWQDCSMLALADSCHYNADIHLIMMGEALTGAGNISGSVIHHTEKFYAAGPAAETEILLFDVEGNPVRYCFSDEGGGFEFTSLPIGTYILQAESTGLFSEPVTITLTEGSPSANGLELNLFNTDITGIAQPDNGDLQIMISPNPVKDILNLTIKSSRHQTVRIMVFGATGTKIHENSGSLKAGDNIFTLPSGNLPEGVYLLKVTSDDRSINKTLKFIK